MRIFGPRSFGRDMGGCWDAKKVPFALWYGFRSMFVGHVCVWFLQMGSQASFVVIRLQRDAVLGIPCGLCLAHSFLFESFLGDAWEQLTALVDHGK